MNDPDWSFAPFTRFIRLSAIPAGRAEGARRPARAASLLSTTRSAIAHWANVPLLAGLVASGLSIYWAAPVFQHAPDPLNAPA